MTNKQAQITINAIKFMLDNAQYSEDVEEALNMAINALTAQPASYRQVTGKLDCIYRQDAIDAMANTLWHYPNECYRNLNKYEFAKGLAELGLKSVPSAQPEIIRCRNCKFASGDSRICMKFGHSPIGELDFCAWAERRTDG